MFQGVLQALEGHGVRTAGLSAKSLVKNVPWAMMLGYSKKEWRGLPAVFFVVAKFRVKAFEPGKYSHRYVNVRLLPDFGILSESKIPSSYLGQALGMSWPSLRRTVSHGENSFLLPKSEWHVNLTASDIPENI